MFNTRAEVICSRGPQLRVSSDRLEEPGIKLKDRFTPIYTCDVLYSSDKKSLLKAVTYTPVLNTPAPCAWIGLIVHTQGGSRISGKGLQMYKERGVRFADFISFLLNIL